ncbi:MAG TPA: M13 family metallopeptidase [Terracidiphilus sp.]|jgi:endothelin-converting enzyme/putative endopeptidase|nr:M13 family metallopeptidase [Terracidiphilus sp.]
MNLLRVPFVLSCFTVCLATVSVAGAQTAPADKVELLPGLDKTLIDTSADPCVDFAAYACGNFPKLHPIPSDKSGYGSGAIVFDYTQQVLHDLLEKDAVDSPSRTANEQKIGDFYATCMNEDAIHATGMKGVEPELARIDALTDKKQLTDLLAHFQMINVNAFFSFGQQQDFKDAKQQIAVVDQGGLGLPERDYYLRTGDAAETTRKQYVVHIGKMLVLMGEPEDKAAADAQKIMDLETALAKVSLDITSQRDPNKVYHLETVEQLSAQAPAIDWPQFFAAAHTPAFTNLNVANPDFFKGLQPLIESTDLDTLKTYLRWQLINSVPSYTMTKAMDEESFDFYSHKLRGTPEQPVRWKRCVGATDGALGEALGQVYVASQFSAGNKAFTLQMVHDIESAMDREIDTLDWMSAETKVKAKAKLHQVANKIGYPDRWRDYSSLNIVRGDALGNATRAVEFENRRLLAKIGTPVDRGEWGMSPSTVDAYYNPSMNDINFPAGILQSPLYDPHATDAENYGHIGGIVGHELTHGFDDEGSQFDGNGNLSDWWTPEDKKKFEAMTDCEVKEYGNFTAVDDVKLNGKLTLGENTADNGGLRLAYLAFLEDAKRKNIDLTAKKGGYTPIQQFFLAHGQNWCGSIRPEQVRLQVQTDPHSPRQFRIIGVIENMPEFGKAFGCKTGQPMMPANACRVW